MYVCLETLRSYEMYVHLEILQSEIYIHLETLHSREMYVHLETLHSREMYVCLETRALTRILKTGVQDSHLAKSRSPTGKIGSPTPKKLESHQFVNTVYLFHFSHK